MYVNEIRYDVVSIAYLSGNLEGSADAIGWMGGKPKLAKDDDYGDDAVPRALKRFSESWNFRRKYLIKDLRVLAESADEFVKDITSADKAATKFLEEVKERGSSGVTF